MIDTDIPGPGKFEGNPSQMVSEYLYSVVQDGSQDEQFGSVEDSHWEALIITDWGMFPSEKGHDPLEDKLKAGYIVTEDNQGFFSYKEYDTDEEAWSKYFADLAAYESYYANGENL